MNRFQSWTATETNEGGAFDRLRRNLSLASSTSTDGTSSSGLNARALDWNDVDGFRVDGDRERQWDFVCGSDLVYSADGADALARCLAQILSHMKAPAVGGDVTSSEGRIAIAQTCGRWGGHGFDEALYRALRRNGLTASPVARRRRRGSSTSWDDLQLCTRWYHPSHAHVFSGGVSSR